LNIITLLVNIGLLLIAMTVHEFAHGYVAYMRGDSTAKLSGRLTLNPLAHLDILWSVILPVLFYISTGFFIAAAKPVPINYWALRDPKRDIVWIGASGPLANLLLAFLLSLVTHFLPRELFLTGLINQLIYINAMLGIFNLIPIPPLDGSRIVMGLLPDDLANRYAQLERYGFIIIMALFMTRILDIILWPAIRNFLYLLRVPF